MKVLADGNGGGVSIASPPQSPGAVQSTAVTTVYIRRGQYLYQVSGSSALNTAVRTYI